MKPAEKGIHEGILEAIGDFKRLIELLPLCFPGVGDPNKPDTPSRRHSKETVAGLTSVLTGHLDLLESLTSRFGWLKLIPQDVLEELDGPLWIWEKIHDELHCRSNKDGNVTFPPAPEEWGTLKSIVFEGEAEDGRHRITVIEDLDKKEGGE